MLDRTSLEEQLADEVCLQLQKDIQARGQASLLVSGGSTPKGLFKILSQREIDWDKVIISLVDERFLPDGHADQNGELIKAHLLQQEASKADYLPMVQDSDDLDRNMDLLKDAVQRIQRPFSVVILGMGGDGHTASLFPESPQLDAGMDLAQPSDLLVTDPVTAPYQRITFTRKALLNTHRLMLHCYGEEKQQVLTKALQQDGYLPYPICGFHGQDGVELEVFWTK